MMETIGTGRTATILYEDSTYSQEILLERCRPQGNGPSPIQYNMAEGILLIKIELDPNVASVYQQMLPPNFTMKFNPPKDLKPIEKEYESHLSKENNRKTDKTNAFADDTTVATLAEFNSLKNLKQILEDFAKFSGLNCNVEKTTITLIGNIAPPTQEILDLGFKFVDKFTLLGLEISNNLEDSLMCFEKIHDKIVSIADFWSKLHLTLPGRITIAKTFMLSQIGYQGCILTPPPGILSRIQQVMDRFCTGNIRIANNRKYLPANSGGMGLINLKDFITGLQSTWVKRCHQHGADNWRNDLLTLCYGNPFILSSEMVNQNRHPIIHNIALSYECFSAEYHHIGKNYMKAYIFKNKLFKRGNRDNNLLCENFFGRNNDFQYFTKIARIRLEDLLIGRQMKSLDEINDSLDVNFTLAIYMRLSGAVHFFLEKKINDIPSIPVGILQFVTSYSKGSQKIRRVLVAKNVESIKIENVNTVVSFSEITGTGGIEPNLLKNIWSFWNFSG
jgi:hypothetical protein